MNKIMHKWTNDHFYTGFPALPDSPFSPFIPCAPSAPGSPYIHAQKKIKNTIAMFNWRQLFHVLGLLVIRFYQLIPVVLVVQQDPVLHAILCTDTSSLEWVLIR